MQLKASTEWLRANPTGRAAGIGVDREAKVIRGYLVAEEGPFKSEGRGEFDADAIKTIRKLMAAEPEGLKSRFAHPTLSDDGLGKFLGRAKSPRLTKEQRGEEQRLAVRADLHLSRTAFTSPSGNLGDYLMDLAEEDPDALGSSLVLRVDQEFRLDDKGRRAKDKAGADLPPLWRPTKLHASDIVDEGDATRAFLGIGGADLPDHVVAAVSMLLDQQFPDDPREVIEVRCLGWLCRYLEERFGPVEHISAARDPRIRKNRRRA
jgi:hypothetical protein